MTPVGRGEDGNWRKYVGIGFQIPAGVGLGCLLGYVADRHFGTAPWLLVAGAAVGFALGMFGFLVTAIGADGDGGSRGGGKDA